MNATGQPLAICYGYQWVTGFRAQYHSLTGTNNYSTTGPEFTKTGCWLLGEGEWDGLQELWSPTLNKKLYSSENDDPAHFHFHRGCDATIGAGLQPSSTGPDQGVDTFFANLPAGVQPNCYNRIAHYWWSAKIAQPYLTLNDDNKKDPSTWIDLDPVGLWRSLKVRLFDSQGALEGYAFSTTPTWQGIDLILRRELFPEFNIDLVNGIDDLPAAVRNRFDWGAMVAHAAWCDAINPNTGRPNASGNFTFNQQATLQSCLGVIHQATRSYQQERNGRIGFYADVARPSVFTLSRSNYKSFTPTDRDLSNAPNRIIGQFRDLLVPAVNGHIVSISYPDHGEPTVTMSEPHPFAANDIVVIGGTKTTYDTYWTVDTIPAGSEAYTFTLKSRGSNYPSAVGDVGALVGLAYSRFKQRTPEWNHKRNQYAKGAVGVGIDRQRKKVQTTIDFHTSTIDQVSRVCRYERDRALGIDADPYLTPVSAEAVLDLYALDAAGSGNQAIGIDPGDHVTIDDTLSVPYAGEYEVLEATAQPDSFDNGRSTPGTVTLKLGTYSTSYMHDDYDATEAGWANVPGSDPGSVASGSTIPLQDGQASFFSGIAASGQTVQMPSGFSGSNFLGWAGAAGYVEANNQLHVFRSCDIDSNRMLSCIYSDGNAGDANTWTGDNSYAGISWRTKNSAALSQIGSMSYVELTLAGGELVIFGSGRVPNGSQIQIPAGYSLANAVCLASIIDGIETGDNDAHGYRAWVDPNGVVHSDYIDGSGNDWTAGNLRVLVFCAKNNMGTVANAGNGWKQIPLAGGSIFSWAGFETYDPGLAGVAPPNHSGVTTSLTTFIPSGQQPVPLPNGLSDNTLQAFTAPTSFQNVAHPTHGVRSCYVDGTGISQTSFEDGEGNVWFGTAAAFLLICDTPSGSSGSSSGGSAGPSPFAIAASSASTSQPGANTTISVTVTPDPSSSGISVLVDASSIGDPANLALSQTQATTAAHADYIVTEGDSTTAGAGLTAAQTWPAKLTNFSYATGHSQIELAAVNGSSINEGVASACITDRYSTAVYPYRPNGSTIRKSFLTLMIGRNDIKGPALSTTTGLITSYVQRAIADGFTVILMVPLDSCWDGNPYAAGPTIYNLNAAQHQTLLDLQSWYRSTGPSVANYVFDAAAVIGNPASTSVTIDGTHLTDASTTLLANALNAFLGTIGATVTFAGNCIVQPNIGDGTYQLPASAMDQQGHLSKASVTLKVQSGAIDAQVQLLASGGTGTVTTNGFNIVNGGSGYTAQLSAQISGQDAVSPYPPKTVTCVYSLDSNGALIALRGGEGEQWNGQPTLTLNRGS